MQAAAHSNSFEALTTQWDLPKPGTLVAQRYRITSLLGEGGMSAVYVARDQRLQRDVALKVLNPNLAYSREVVARFVNEARTLARLGCPHIVQVFDAGVVNEPGHAPLPFMVLELLRGCELRALSDEGIDDDARIVSWMLQACEGLAAAHGEGIIHRDLKPENLFVATERDGSERLKLLDFGIARSPARVQHLTLAGEGVGSPGYMSPEQIRDATSVDARSDIWSLGVVMFELFARQAPFRAPSSLELCAQILNAPIPSLRDVRPDIDPGLAAIVDRCLSRDVEKRFQNVLELAEALTPYAERSMSVPAERIRRRLSSREPIDLSDGLEGRDSEQAEGTEVVRSGVRKKHLPSRVLFARSVAVLSLAGLLSLLAAATLPGTTTRYREGVSAASARISEAAQDLFHR